MSVKEATLVVTEQRTRVAPRWNVILMNDDDHTYPYVIGMLRRLFGMSETDARLRAKEVDRTGRVILLTTSREHAELKQEQIQAEGPDPLVARCAGPMSAIVEPAP